MKKEVILTAIICIALAIIAVLYSRSDSLIAKPPLKLLGKTNQEAIKKCLTVQVMDRTFQFDGKVEVVYTNICNNYKFQLQRTGLKYKSGKKIKFLSKDTPVFLSAGDMKTLELSIPIGVTPRVAYAFEDDAKAFLIE